MVARWWVRSLDRTVCLFLSKTLYFTLFQFTQLKMSIIKKLGVNLAIDQRSIQGEYCTLSCLMSLLLTIHVLKVLDDI